MKLKIKNTNDKIEINTIKNNRDKIKFNTIKNTNDKIEINVDSTITRLVGNDYGQEIFKKISPAIKYDGKEKNIIKFPEHVNRVGISFIQGFVKNIPEEYQRDFYKYFTIEGNDDVKEKFKKTIVKMI